MTSKLDRRAVLKSIGAGAAAASFSGWNPPLAAQEVSKELTSVKAIVFDTFGTIVDWRNSVIAEGIAWDKAKGLTIDWAIFADQWRLGYHPAMNKVRTGEIPWTRLDDLHRMILEDLLKEYKIDNLTEEEKVSWTHVWRRLKPWPDSVEGLTRLKKKYIIAPLSNGNIALMANLAKFGGLPWDAILGAELVRHYKPDDEVYRSAPYFLDLKPEEVMMVAAHDYDLHAARRNGLRTGFIHRPTEYGKGPVGVAYAAKPGEFDVVSESAVDLARQMGA
ncbi:MAG: haloacid dehalogenase type II [Candidatus Acidiferrales bacterium]